MKYHTVGQETTYEGQLVSSRPNRDNNRMKAFLICPVRGSEPDRYKHYVEKLENSGWIVHFPPRDTNQDDLTGYNICVENLEAIRNADKVFIVWDGKSTGSLFDAGMAFALGKKVSVLFCPDPLGSKSFQDMFTEWQRRSYE